MDARYARALRLLDTVEGLASTARYYYQSTPKDVVDGLEALRLAAVKELSEAKNRMNDRILRGKTEKAP